VGPIPPSYEPDAVLAFLPGQMPRPCRSCTGSWAWARRDPVGGAGWRPLSDVSEVQQDSSGPKSPA
jgi:hypothetical protein